MMKMKTRRPNEEEFSMRKREPISSEPRNIVSVLIVTLLLSIACATGAAPSVSTTSQGPQSSTSSAEANLKKENLTYADRLAWRTRLNWSQDCESTFDYPDKSFAGLAFYGVSEKYDLVQVTCTLGSYQGTYVFLLLDKSVSPAKSTVLHFISYEDSGESGPGRLKKTQASELTGTPDFDQGSKQLRVIHKFRGLGDCGFLTSYGFPKGEPELIQLQDKLECDGKVINPRDWKAVPLR
jgi:Protein of unknown function (DUF1176)